MAFLNFLAQIENYEFKLNPQSKSKKNTTKNTLYLILPYYNYYQNINRENNLMKIIDYYKNFNCNLILVEGISSSSKPLEDLSSKIFKHIKYSIPQNIWIKENLIDLAFKNHLPQNWQYACWIDADSIILDKNFVKKTISLLKKNDIIQMFNFAFNKKYLKPDQNNSETLFIDPLEIGYINFHISFKEISICENNYHFDKIQKHTGFGWGLNKNFYKKISDIIDFNVIGGGDRLIAKCITQNLKRNERLDGRNFVEIYSKKYLKQINVLYKKFKNCKFSYLDSFLLHLSHGDVISKQYNKRHQILKKYKFDKSMASKNKDGIIFLKNQNLVNNIASYMESREKNAYIPPKIIETH